MIPLSLIAYEDATKAVMIADWSNRVSDLTFETDEHGFGVLMATIPMPTERAFRIYDGIAFAHVLLSNGASVAFEGRIEDRSIIPGGLRISAYGYQRAFSDLDYAGYWSVSGPDQWIIMTSADRTGTINEAYRLDKRNRLRIDLEKNGVYTNATTIGRFGINYDGRADIAYVTFDYDVYLPTNMSARLYSTTGNYAASATLEGFNIAGNGSSQTGTNSEAITASSKSLFFQIIPTADVTYTGETGARYVEITNLRVTGLDGTVYADEIAADIVAFVSGTNSTQLSTSTVLVSSPAQDIENAVYVDMPCNKVLDDLAQLGDGSTVYEWGVWEGQRLHFRERGSAGRSWYVDIGDIRVDSTIDDMYNSVYGIYTYGSETRHTNAVTDATSVAKYGVTRLKALKTQAKGSGAAQAWLGAFLDDHKDAIPRTQITVDRIFTASGARSDDLSQVRSGDTLTIRNLPPGSGGVVDNIRTMFIIRTRMDVLANELTIYPGAEPPSLELLVARNSVK